MLPVRQGNLAGNHLGPILSGSQQNAFAAVLYQNPSDPPRSSLAW